eukprot:gene9288-10946_t
MLHTGEGVYVNKHGIVHEGVWKEGVFTGTKRELVQSELMKEKKGERWPENVSASTPAAVADAIAEQKPSMTPTGPTIVRKIDNKGIIYEGEFKNGYRHGYGITTYPEGKVYKGNYAYDIRSGYGTLTYSDGNSVTGIFQNNRIYHGKGAVVHDVLVEHGEWLDGVRVGDAMNVKRDGSGVFKGPEKQGKLTSAAGVYVGEIEEFKPHGKGVYEYIDGTVYEGSFMRGQRDGWAKVIYANKNEVLEGQFMFDRMFKGQGVLHNSDGSVYNGEIDNFKYTTGVLTYANGSTYEGIFSDNLPYNGVGCGNVGEKDVYCGNWVDGAATGSGQISYGHWVDGLKQGTGTYTYLNGGRMLVGEYTLGKRNGVHTLMYPSTGYEVQVEYSNDTLVENGCVYIKDDLVFEGTLLNNAYHGQGTLTYPDGAQFVGTFDNGQIVNGKGTFYFADGTSYAGEWQRGKKHGYDFTATFDSFNLCGGFSRTNNTRLCNGAVLSSKVRNYSTD